MLMSEDNLVAVGDNGLIRHFNGDDWQEVG